MGVTGIKTGIKGKRALLNQRDGLLHPGLDDVTLDPVDQPLAVCEGERATAGKNARVSRSAGRGERAAGLAAAGRAGGGWPSIL